MIPATDNFRRFNDELAKTPVFLIEVEGYWISFVNVKTSVASQQPILDEVDDLSITVSELDGGSELGELSFTVLDLAHAITKSFPLFVFEGKKVTLKTGTADMAQADFALLFTGVVDTVDSVDENTAYKFTCTDHDKLSKVIYTTADDGFPTDSNHLRTLNGHPLDMLLAILSTELGLDAGSYDSAKIVAYRDSIFAGVQFEFSIDSPPAAKDFIEQQIMKQLGGYLRTTYDGKVSVNFFYPLSSEVADSISEATIVGVPTASQSDLVNVMSFRFDKDQDSSGSGKYMAEVVEQYGPSIDKYGQFGQVVIESDGMRSGLQGFFVGASSSRLVFLKYGMKPLKFEPVTLLWNHCRLESGDVVFLSHPSVPDRELGKMGVTGKKFVVTDRVWRFADGEVDLTLVDASFLDSFGFYRYAADGTGDYTAAAPSDQATDMFLCGDDDKYTNGDPAYKLG